jgi:signal transduction histidine kinase
MVAVWCLLARTVVDARGQGTPLAFAFHEFGHSPPAFALGINAARGGLGWQGATTRWLPGVLIILTLAALAGFVISYLQLKAESDRRRRLSGMLIAAEETERRRIASELHDDFSQRLALLALNLDNAAELIGESPEDAKQRLRDVFNSAGEISADLHTLSHRLHSSTLENLGLVPGIDALCKEFGRNYGIEVEFAHSGIPRSVSPDSALCVFRIVQESLRNLKKHSGASKGYVGLRCKGVNLLLNVTDVGIGFNPNGSKSKAGLGIRSMEERANLLGGMLAIESTPGRGTKIRACVPLYPKLATITTLDKIGRPIPQDHSSDMANC